MTDLKHTSDLDIFVYNEVNRPITPRPNLEKSLLKYGFLSSHPLHVVQLDTGKLKVICGHHRLHHARLLNITPVWYVIDDTVTDVYELESDARTAWNLEDFARSYEDAGLPAYVALGEYQRRHNMPLAVAVSLVAGETAGSSNWHNEIKNGTYRVGNMEHANKVAEVTDLCRSVGVEFATQTPFVCAVSAALRVPELDVDWLLGRVSGFHHRLKKKSNKHEYIEGLEDLYNHNKRQDRLNLSWRVNEVMRERAAGRYDRDGGGAA